MICPYCHCDDAFQLSKDVGVCRNCDLKFTELESITEQKKEKRYQFMLELVKKNLDIDTDDHTFESFTMVDMYLGKYAKGRLTAEQLLDAIIEGEADDI